MSLVPRLIYRDFWAREGLGSARASVKVRSPSGAGRAAEDLSRWRRARSGSTRMAGCRQSLKGTQEPCGAR